MKNDYLEPQLVVHGPVEALTAAVGPGGQNDQSDYPEQFPPNNGSFDVCNNTDPNSTC